MSGTTLSGAWRPFTALQRVLRARLVFVLVILSGLLLVLGSPAVAAAETKTLTHEEVSTALFVAGDVARLSDPREGTESLVLEKALQEIYTENPTLVATTGEYEIHEMEYALKLPSAPSEASLRLMAGNQRILAILAALERNLPTPSFEPYEAVLKEAKLAVTHVAAIALAGSSEESPTYFEPLGDERANLAYTSFSPATVLRKTREMAEGDQAFGEARNVQWESASGENVFWKSTELFEKSPVLGSEEFEGLKQDIEAEGGSLTKTPKELIALFEQGQQKAQDQVCEHDEHGTGEIEVGTKQAEGGATIPGVPRLKCKGGALYEASTAARTATETEEEVNTKVEDAQHNAARRAALIREEQAVMTSAAELMRPADEKNAEVLAAAAQAQTKITEGEQAWAAYEAEQKKANLVSGILQIIAGAGTAAFSFATGNVGEGVAGLVGVAFKIWSLTEEYTVVAPASTEELTMQSLTALHAELSGFEQYTQEAFHAVNVGLAKDAVQVAQVNYQVGQLRSELGLLGKKLSTLQHSLYKLQDEVQTLFSARVKAELETTIANSVGWFRRTGETLPASGVQESLIALDKYATEIANGSLVNKTPPPYTFEGAARALAAGPEPEELSEDISYLARFPVEQGWLGVSLPATLANTTFWNEGARAYSQLMLENASDVTAGNVTSLKALEREGVTLEAVQKTWSEKASTDPIGPTDNTLLNEALAKVDQAAAGQGHGGEPGGLEGNESLTEQLKATFATTFEEHLQANSGVKGNPTHVDPWGGALQSIEAKEVEEAHYLAFRYEYAKEKFAYRTEEEIETVPQVVVNGVRLGDVGAIGSNRPWEEEILPGFVRPGVYGCAELKLYHEKQLVYNGLCNSGALTAALKPLWEDINKNLIEELHADAYMAAASASESEQGQGSVQSLAAAKALVQSYVRLGLPQAVTSDQALESDLAGTGAQFLAPGPEVPQALPGEYRALLANWQTTRPKEFFATTRTGQEIEEYAKEDPLGEVERQSKAWTDQIATDVKPYVDEAVVGLGGSGPEAVNEESALLESTINRLQLTRDLFTESKAPTAETLAPAEVGTTGAVLKGEVDPYGAGVESCQFEYGTSQSYGHVAPCETAIPRASYEHSVVSAKVVGWTPEGGFHERLAVKTWAGTSYGEDVKVQLAHLLSVETGITKATTRTTASVTGVVDPNGSDVTTCRFLLAPVGTAEVIEAACGKQVGGGTAPVPETSLIKGLKVGTKYEYWLQAQDKEGEVANGVHLTFTTKPGTKVGLRTSTGELKSGASVQLVLKELYFGTGGPGGKYGYCDRGGLTGKVVKIGSKTEIRFNEGRFEGEDVEGRCGISFNWNFEAEVFAGLPWHLILWKSATGQLNFSLGAIEGRTILVVSLSEPQAECRYALPGTHKILGVTSFGPTSLPVKATPIQLIEAPDGVGECDTEAPAVQGAFELQSEGLPVTSVLK